MATGKSKQDTSVTCVGCNVNNCKFNDEIGRYCTADRISVQNKTACSKGETFCDTFIARGSF